MNRNAIDIWTLAHLAVGVIMALAGATRTTAYAVAIGTEIIEIGLRKTNPEFFEESQQNIVTDILATTTAFEVTNLFIS